MSLDEKNAIKIVFAIDNNYYLISNEELLNYLYKMKLFYKRYIHNHDVMALNLYKLKMGILQEFMYQSQDKNSRGINNILDVLYSVINNDKNDEYYNRIKDDINILQTYLNIKK